VAALGRTMTAAKRILVTGGAGFIGSALARRLVREGHTVTVFDDFSRGREDRLPGFPGRMFAGDIRDRGAVARAAEDCDTIFHLAYVQGTQTFYSEPRLVMDVALNGITNVLHACEKQGGKDLLLVSSSEVYAIPPEGFTPTDETVPLSVPDVCNSRYSYGGGKIACELAALAYADVNKRTVIIRPHNVYGADMGEEHVIPQMARRMQGLVDGEDFGILGTGEETRCFCYVDDCVDAFMGLLDKGDDRNVYHVGNPYREITMRQLARLIAEHYGVQIVSVVPSELPQGSPPRRLPDISKLQALGFDPKWPLWQGIVPTLDWYREAACPVAV
jgi:nucleoside-diphosphate-sugar epimerase